MADRNPELLVKRLILLVFGLLAIGAGGVAIAACVRASVVHGDSPLMLVGILGGLAGIAAGVYFAWLAFNPQRAFPRG